MIPVRHVDQGRGDHANAIWRVHKTLDELNAMSRDTMQSLLDIAIVEIGPDYLMARMPVTQRVHQPHGVLHGGASVTLAETTGSMAASLCAPEGRRCVGIEVNANHVAEISEGDLWCVARPAHIGGATQVWQMRIFTKADRTICVARLTVAVLGGKREPTSGAGVAGDVLEQGTDWTRAIPSGRATSGGTGR